MAQRILVVEDEPAIADNITYALRTEGLEVAWCTTGEEVARALRRLLVSDRHVCYPHFVRHHG